MTIQGWVLFGILALFILSFGIFGAIIFEKIVWKVLSVVAAMLLIIGLFAGMRWYYLKSVFWMKLSSQSTKRSSSTNSPPEYRILTKQLHTKRSILP